MKQCEECGLETNQTHNGLCEKCFNKEEKKGSIIAIYPKIYSFDGIDSVVTKWDLERTKKWYENFTGADTNEMNIEEIDIEKYGYWDCNSVTEEDRNMLDVLSGSQYTEIKIIGNKRSFGDLRSLWGDCFKYISYKQGILKYCMDIKEPEIIASTEF